MVMEKHGETYSCKSPPKQSEEVSIPIDFLPNKFNAVVDIAIKVCAVVDKYSEVVQLHVYITYMQL